MCAAVPLALDFVAIRLLLLEILLSSASFCSVFEKGKEEGIRKESRKRTQWRTVRFQEGGECPIYLEIVIWLLRCRLKPMWRFKLSKLAVPVAAEEFVDRGRTFLQRVVSLQGRNPVEDDAVNTAQSVPKVVRVLKLLKAPPD